jgi:hypothetical protein
MTRIFLAIAQYKKFPDAEAIRVARALDLQDWQPSGNGFHPMFEISMFNLLEWARITGNEIFVNIVNGDGNLPRVRSIQAAVWRNEWDKGNCFDCITFMDDDISFVPESLEYLIQDDKPIVGGIYTFKSQHPYYTGRVCTRLMTGVTVTDKEAFEVEYLNGGFIMVQASTMLDLMDKYNHLQFTLGENNPSGVKKAWAIHCPFVHNGLFLSEDWALSQRARDAGYKIYGDLRCSITHWSGEFGYKIHM